MNNLLEIHGPENCRICGFPKATKGNPACSHPHAMIPDPNAKDVPEGFISWIKPPNNDFGDNNGKD